jgi:hypothetical protein
MPSQPTEITGSTVPDACHLVAHRDSEGTDPGSFAAAALDLDLRQLAP